MTQLVAQIILAALLFLGFFARLSDMLKDNVPFWHAVTSIIIIYTISLTVFYFAGAFSCLLPK